MYRSALIILTLAVLAAACGGDGAFGTTSPSSSTPATESTPPTSEPSTSVTEPPPATTSTTPATTTAATTSTTTSATTTTAPETFYFVDTSHFFPDVFPESNGSHGSGCVTPGFDVLPNGVWFGFAEAVGGGTITFDLACFFTGAAAEDAAAEDGAEAFDFYIRNLNPTTFEVPVAADARVWYVDMLSGDVSVPTEIPLAAWPSPDSFQTCPGEYCSVWLYVNGGQVTGIVEQYLP